MSLGPVVIRCRRCSSVATGYVPHSGERCFGVVRESASTLQPEGPDREPGVNAAGRGQPPVCRVVWTLEVPRAVGETFTGDQARETQIMGTQKGCQR